MKLKSISLRNFKSFKELKNLEFTPITIFCGNNSSGKSTIIQSLLLLKQTIESSYDKSPLLLNGDFVKLDSYKNIVFGHDESVAIGIDLTLERTTKKNESRLTKINSNFILNEETLILKNLEFEEEFESNNKIGNRTINLVHNQADSYIIESKNMKGFLGFGEDFKKEQQMSVSIKFKAMVPRPVIRELIPDQKSSFSQYIIYATIGRPLEQIFPHFHYIGPLRDFPKRRDWRDSEVIEMGTKGENVANIFLNEMDRKLNSDFYLYNEEKKDFVKLEESSLFGRLSVWAKLLNFSLLNKDKKDAQIASIQLDSFTGKDVTIADVGFGLSQILPILTEGIRIDKSDTLILEQPEIHLHPGMQTSLGDFLISLALANKNCIVETHSDHLINRLVRRVIEDPEGKLKDMVTIYFIENISIKDGSSIQKIQIDENKGIVNWPEGFFDQGADEKEKIIDALLKKKRKG